MVFVADLNPSDKCLLCEATLYGNGHHAGDCCTCREVGNFPDAPHDAHLVGRGVSR